MQLHVSSIIYSYIAYQTLLHLNEFTKKIDNYQIRIIELIMVG